ncbi:hypothetical protein LEN26_005657 [Aphanomyces euteiches]|nr:hypothetical protein LEN26_005657 [Aphanomyces euteiches]
MADEVFAAVSSGDVDQVRQLLEDSPANVNAIKKINKVSYTPLMVAAEQGDVDMVEYLLSHKEINVNCPSSETKKTPTPLMRAITKGHEDIVRLLIQHPDLDVNEVMEKNESAIQKAAMHGRVTIVDLLWDKVDLPSKERCLDAALNANKFEVVALILEKGFECNLKFRGHLLLEFVARYLQQEAFVEMLLRDLPFDIQDGFIVVRTNHLFSWTTFLKPTLIVDESVSKESIVEALLNHKLFKNLDRESLARHLVYSKDEYGREAYFVATADMRDFLRKQLYFANRYEIIEGPPMHASESAVILLAYDHGICTQVFHEYASTEGLNLDGFINCNNLLGRLSTDRRASDNEETVEQLWSNEFDMLDTSNGGLMSEDTFKIYCEKHFGSKLKVALKFMRYQDEYNREITIRKQLDAKFALGLLPSLDESVFREHAVHLKVDDELSMGEYPFVLVMPAADRSLEDVYLKERRSPTYIRFALEEVVLALQHLHSKAIVHGDLKKLNVLRVHNGFKLIDFDASTFEGKPMGMKFSSGILPPEMFYKLQNSSERAQYEQSCNLDEWSKLRPKHNFVVRSFRGEEKVPYSFVEASPSVDMWALGCMMFQLWTGIELVSTDVNQDVVPDRIEIAATWTDEKMKAYIEENIQCRVKRDLLQHLLVVDPRQRISCQDVLNHPYFTGTDTVNSTRANEKKVAPQNVRFDTAQFSGKAPTTFVILPFRVENRQAKEVLLDFSQFAARFAGFCHQILANPTRRTPREMIDSFTLGKPMYFYLVDEIERKLAVNDFDAVYPIEIPPNQHLLLSSMLPFVQRGLKLVLHEHSNQSDALSAIQEAHRLVESVPPLTFDLLASLTTNPVHDVQQLALDMLEQFYCERDPEDSFAGLERVMTSERTLAWTSKSHAHAIRRRRTELLGK